MMIPKEDGAMSVSKNDLTRDELGWLEALARGGGQLITRQAADRLRELGLVDQKLGGPAINDAGKRLLRTGNA